MKVLTRIHNCLGKLIHCLNPKKHKKKQEEHEECCRFEPYANSN